MFLESLKSKSKPYHDKLELHPINKSLFLPNATKEDYIDFLEVQYHIWGAIEKKITSYQDELDRLGIVFHSRSNDAKEELQALGKSPKNIDLDNSSMETFLDALGALYLLEGSKHGAMHIIKIAKNLNDEDHKFLFLEVNPKEFFENWKNLMTATQNYLIVNNLEDEFINRVCNLYEKMGTMYDKCATTNNL